jgi:hypothetical protein
MTGSLGSVQLFPSGCGGKAAPRHSLETSTASAAPVWPYLETSAASAAPVWPYLETSAASAARFLPGRRTFVNQFRKGQ